MAVSSLLKLVATNVLFPRAAIWQDETENGMRHNVTISRLYKDGDDWKDSTSFGRNDLPLVVTVSDQAHSWIFEHNSENPTGTAPAKAAAKSVSNAASLLAMSQPRGRQGSGERHHQPLSICIPANSNP